MIDWLAVHGGLVVLVLFFTLFLMFAFWAYVPANKNKMDEYGQIPFKEKSDGE